MKRNYHIIGACSCWGAQIRSCERGPEDLVDGKMVDRLQAMGVQISELEMIYPRMRARDEEIPLSSALPIIREFNLSLSQAVSRAKKNGSFPIVLGGDHAIAVGTWNGVEGPLGLLWIDAHMDAHTPQTTPSGAYHGMPVAALLGYGDPRMAQLLRPEPVLCPENIALIGVRSFEEGEADLLNRLNVRVYFIDEVKKRGLKEILPEAVHHVMQGAANLGVSVDLDVFDPREAPGVGSPEAGGILAKDFLPFLPILRDDPRLAAFEMVEFNPGRDPDHRTRELAFSILTGIMR